MDSTDHHETNAVLGATGLGSSNDLGLAGALAAMVALFSLLNPHFLTYDTSSTIANPIPDLVVMAVAAARGTVTGAITVGWRIPSFIVSLGVLEAARGLACQMANSRTAYIGDAFDLLSNPIARGLSPAFPIALTRTVFGRHLAGIGTNEQAVRLAGVDPRPYKAAVFARRNRRSWEIDNDVKVASATRKNNKRERNG